MTELWLIRHGETDWNLARRIQGWRDVELNEAGRLQARRLADRLGGEGHVFDAIYSSDLRRAHATALSVAARLGMDVRLEPRVRERRFGVLESLTPDEMDARQPEASAAWRARDLDHPLGGGESLREFHRRVVQAMDAIAASHPGQRVLAFTHGGVLDIVWRHAHRLALSTPRHEKLLNCAINRVACAGDGWRILDWGDASHICASADDIV